MFWYGQHMNGLGYALMFISMIAFWGLVISLFVWRPTRLHASTAPLTPAQILAGRFARGEISHDEYASRQAALDAHPHA